MRAIKGGCGTRHTKGFKMTRPMGVSNYVLLVVRTPGEFQIGQNKFSVMPIQTIVIAPNTPYSYGNPNGYYVNDWLHFDAGDSDIEKQLAAISNKPILVETHNVLTFCIWQLLWELSYGKEDCVQANTDALFTLLLNHLIYSYEESNKLKANNQFQQKLQLLRLEMRSSSYDHHSIQEYAKKLNISESYFQSLYKEMFEISFQQDLISLRVDNAKNILTSTDLSIERVAVACGYSSGVHFYRQFKKLTGKTPAKYRRDAKEAVGD